MNRLPPEGGGLSRAAQCHQDALHEIEDADPQMPLQADVPPDPAGQERGHPVSLSSQQALKDILLKVGELNYTWTNTESLLIHLIAGLLGTTKDKAMILFLTLNTTRARVDLVERLVKQEGAKTPLGDDILPAMTQLSRQSSLRNRYNHCIYSFDRETGDVSTILMRIQDRKTDIRVGKTQQVDAEEMAKIDAAISGLQRLNHDIWAIVQKYNFPI